MTADSIVTACYAMGNVCTGALIVVEQAIRLNEYEMTGNRTGLQGVFSGADQYIRT